MAQRRDKGTGAVYAEYRAYRATVTVGDTTYTADGATATAATRALLDDHPDADPERVTTAPLGEPRRWRGEVTVRGKRYRVTGKDKTEAKRLLRQITAKRDTGQFVDTPTKTVADAVKDFRRTLPTRARGGRLLAPASRARWEDSLRHIVEHLGPVKLDDLETDDVDRMLDRLAERPVRPLSAASLSKLRGHLRIVLQHQVDRRKLTFNAAIPATLPAEAKPEEKRQALAPDDARRLLVALRGEYNGVMYALMLRLGLRPGEAAGLYWVDLVRPDVGPALLNITRGLRAEGNRLVVSDSLKTAGSRRTIALPDDLADWLADHRRDQLERRRRAEQKGRPWDDPDLMFASVHGRPLARKATREKLARICREAEVYVLPVDDDETPRPPRPNELRHSCASLLSDEGVPHSAIADLLGHESTRMVDRTYRHRLRPVVDVAARATWAEGVH